MTTNWQDSLLIPHIYTVSVCYTLQYSRPLCTRSSDYLVQWNNFFEVLGNLYSVAFLPSSEISAMSASNSSLLFAKAGWSEDRTRKSHPALESMGKMVHFLSFIVSQFSIMLSLLGSRNCTKDLPVQSNASIFSCKRFFICLGTASDFSSQRCIACKELDHVIHSCISICYGKSGPSSFYSSHCIYQTCF